jgi:hypothetical protein
MSLLPAELRKAASVQRPADPLWTVTVALPKPEAVAPARKVGLQETIVGRGRLVHRFTEFTDEYPSR